MCSSGGESCRPFEPSTHSVFWPNFTLTTEVILFLLIIYAALLLPLFKKLVGGT
jgi:hypothetical protein